ncbi:MAG: hypothetical protein H6R26_3351, partial [Proteobacteria bacterium]|nr:hypothetical protein [Pseudomonadota bacterium]
MMIITRPKLIDEMDYAGRWRFLL